MDYDYTAYIQDRHDSKEYRTILRSDPCSYRGARGGIQIDHIRPSSANPLHGFDARITYAPETRWAKMDWDSWRNMTSACASCNARKRDHPLLIALLNA